MITFIYYFLPTIIYPSYKIMIGGDGKMKTQKIKELAEINSGIRQQKIENPQGKYEYKIITLNVDGEYTRNLENAEVIKTETPLDDMYILKKGDILMMLKPNYLAKTIEFNEKNVTTPLNYVIIHNKDIIPSHLLTFYLNSTDTKKQIARYAEKTLVPILKMSTINQIQIKRIEKNIEKKLSKLISLISRRKKLLKRRETLENQILNYYIKKQESEDYGRL